MPGRGPGRLGGGLSGGLGGHLCLGGGLGERGGSGGGLLLEIKIMMSDMEKSLKVQHSSSQNLPR